MTSDGELWTNGLVGEEGVRADEPIVTAGEHGFSLGSSTQCCAACMDNVWSGGVA